MFAGRDFTDRIERPGVEHHDAGRAPDRHEQRRSVGRYHAGVRLGGQLDRPHHAAAGEIDGAERLADDVDGEEPAAIRADGEAADQISRRRVHHVVPLDRRLERTADHEIDRPRQLTFVPAQLVDRAVSGARDVQPLAVRVPRQPEPGVIEQQRRADVQLIRIDNGDGGPVIPVGGHHQRSAVGRFGHREREMTDGDVAPGRRDLPSVRQQRDAAAHGARSRRRRAVAVRRRDHGEDRQRRARGECGSAHVTRYLTTTRLMSTPFRGVTAHHENVSWFSRFRCVLRVASVAMIEREVEALDENAASATSSPSGSE